MSLILRRIVRKIIFVPTCKFYETCRHYPAPRKRFYKSVSVTESDGKFEVNLDKRKLKTPLGNLLQLPNEALATAVATEWSMQGDTLQQQNMHITSLCNTALDNPCRETKETLADSALQFLDSDTLWLDLFHFQLYSKKSINRLVLNEFSSLPEVVHYNKLFYLSQKMKSSSVPEINFDLECDMDFSLTVLVPLKILILPSFRASEPPELVDLQNEKWNPLLHWFRSRYQVEINECEDVSSTPVTEQGLQEIRKQLLSYNNWCLLGINFAAENLKSLILAFAIINHRVDIDTAVYLSRLETIFQVNHWGNVEWSHDVDKAQTTSRVAAAALFVYLNEGSTNYVEKFSVKKESSQKIKAEL